MRKEKSLNLYRQLYQSGRFTESVSECRSLLRASNNLDVSLVLTLSLVHLGELSQALELALSLAKRESLSESQRSIFFQIAGDSSRGLGLEDQALECYQRASELDPGRADAHYVLARLFYERNRFAEALSVVERVFENGINPSEQVYAQSVSLFSRVSRTETASSFFERNPHLKAESKHFSFYFGYAELLTRDKLYSSAFESYQIANEMKRRSAPYDLAADLSLLRKHLERFDDNFFSSRMKFEISNPIPIFIVGMPRTGSSLVEQMLGAHSEVCPMGEVPWLMNSLENCLRSYGGRNADHEVVMRLCRDHEFLCGVRREYFKNFRGVNATFATDKMLNNFQVLWLIFAAFPEAIILHSRREKLPTIWSCFKSDFEAGNRFSESLRESSLYFDVIIECASSWGGGFGDNFIELQYEELIEEPEQTLEVVLRNLGLNLEPQCLDPSKIKRRVATASRTQVALPLYDKPNQDWLPFREHLLEVLKEES